MASFSTTTISGGNSSPYSSSFSSCSKGLSGEVSATFGKGVFEAIKDEFLRKPIILEKNDPLSEV